MRRGDIEECPLRLKFDVLKIMIMSLIPFPIEMIKLAVLL
jgi:hypothetical protein